MDAMAGSAHCGYHDRGAGLGRSRLLRTGSRRRHPKQLDESLASPTPPYRRRPDRRSGKDRGSGRHLPDQCNIVSQERKHGCTSENAVVQGMRTSLPQGSNRACRAPVCRNSRRIHVPRLMPTYHCSPRVLARNRTLSQQIADWQRIRTTLQVLRDANKTRFWLVGPRVNR